MVEVTVAIDSAGIVREISAVGHVGGYKKGSNPVCAAVTILVRTYLRLVESGGCEPVEGEAPKAGELFARIGKPGEDRQKQLLGAGEFLLTGLSDLQETFPQHCVLRVQTFKE
jgi:uncharacterized protein YsxB (DUF464 family)